MIPEIMMSLHLYRLSYVEMRLVLARLLFKFDLKLMEETHDWVERGKAYNIWWKPPLKVQLIRRKGLVKC